MRSILKYPLSVQSGVVLLPEGAVVRHIGAQPDAPPDILFVWAEVDLDNALPDAPPADRQTQFAVFGTGHDLPADMPMNSYQATVQHHGFVWHIYGPFRNPKADS